MLGVSRAYVAVGMLGQGFLVLDTFRQVRGKSWLWAVTRGPQSPQP